MAWNTPKQFNERQAQLIVTALWAKHDFWHREADAADRANDIELAAIARSFVRDYAAIIETLDGR